MVNTVNIVAIGGGGGLSRVSRALKVLPEIMPEAKPDTKEVQTTYIVGVTDFGGSTGDLRLAYRCGGEVGDLTRNIVALSPNEKLARALGYKFKTGPFLGQSLKNLIQVGFWLQNGGDSVAAAELFSWMVRSTAQVIPMANKPSHLFAKLSGGNIIRYESKIDTLGSDELYHPTVHKIKDVFIRPVVSISKAARQAIERADYIVIAPGDFWSTINAILCIKGVREAIRASRGKLIMILNLITKKGETDGYRAEDFLEKIHARAGRRFDRIVVNTAPMPEEIRKNYRREKKVVLARQLSSLQNGRHPWLIKRPLAMVELESGHWCHDPALLAGVFREIFSGQA